MSIDRKQLKSEAKQAMSAARPAPFWVTLAVLAIVLILNVLTMSLDGTITAVRTMYAAALEGQLVYTEPQAVGGIVGWLLGLAVQIMLLEIGVGFVLYSMRVWRRQRAGVGDLFDAFGVFFRAIWIQLLPSVMVSVWSLLYVVPVSSLVMMTGQVWWTAAGLPLLLPALMALYSYRLATYLMLDEPEMSCWQCLMLSRRIMQGHRWEAFVLDLSFLGWALLCAVPVAGLILMVWLTGYMQVTNAGFYERLAGTVRTEDIPSPGPQPPEY